MPFGLVPKRRDDVFGEGLGFGMSCGDLFDLQVGPLAAWIGMGRGHCSPACDVEELEKEYVVRMDLPGVSKEQVRLELTDDVLTVSADVNEEMNVEKSGYVRRERRRGSFRRSVRLPGPADTAGAKASLSNGVLEVRLPKKADSSGRNIEIA